MGSMTGPARVSVLVPIAGLEFEAAAAPRELIERYLETTGFTFEILTPSAATYGAALRKGAAEASGSVIVVVDASMPYPISAIGDAVAMIDSGATEVVFGTKSRAVERKPPALIRWHLVPELPETSIRLKAF